jgi:hypothetical protein
MPKTYSSYMDTMESMLETIKGLEEALGIDKTHFQSHLSINGEYVSSPSFTLICSTLGQWSTNVGLKVEVE